MWQNVTDLELHYSPACNIICSQLQNIETLNVTQTSNDPGIPLIIWSNLKKLTDLGWFYPNFDLISNLVNLNITSLDLVWDDRFNLNCNTLAKCLSISTLGLDCESQSDFGRFSSLERITELPKLSRFTCNIHIEVLLAFYLREQCKSKGCIISGLSFQ